jgi:hypothetical protein
MCANIAEKVRLTEDKHCVRRWKFFGPYLSERQWGTVREDYSPGGTAWEYFPHEHARSRAYRWGEDGIAGVSDTHGRFNIAFSFWNEKEYTFPSIPGLPRSLLVVNF